MNNTKDISIVEILEPFLTDKYARIKEDIIECYTDMYISDLKEDNNYEITYVFSDMMIDAVKPVNKPLTYFFVKNNSEEIIDIINKKLTNLYHK